MITSENVEELVEKVKMLNMKREMIIQHNIGVASRVNLVLSEIHQNGIKSESFLVVESLVRETLPMVSKLIDENNDDDYITKKEMHQKILENLVTIVTFLYEKKMKEIENVTL